MLWKYDIEILLFFTEYFCDEIKATSLISDSNHSGNYSRHPMERP